VIVRVVVVLTVGWKGFKHSLSLDIETAMSVRDSETLNPTSLRHDYFLIFQFLPPDNPSQLGCS
jgi:hypothetical protein